MAMVPDSCASQLAAIDHALFENVRVRAFAGLCLAGGAGIPGVVFPGCLFRLAVGGVVAAVEIDIAYRLARLELKGPRRPFQIAGRQYLSRAALATTKVGLRHRRGESYTGAQQQNCANAGSHRDRAIASLVCHDLTSGITKGSRY